MTNDHCIADCHSDRLLVAPEFAALVVGTEARHAEACHGPLRAADAPPLVDQQEDGSHSHLLTFEHDLAGYTLQHLSNCPRTVAGSVQAEQFDCLVLSVSHSPSQRFAWEVLGHRLWVDLLIQGPSAGGQVWVWVGWGQPGVGCMS